MVGISISHHGHIIDYPYVFNRDICALEISNILPHTNNIHFVGELCTLIKINWKYIYNVKTDILWIIYEFSDGIDQRRSLCKLR